MAIPLLLFLLLLLLLLLCSLLLLLQLGKKAARRAKRKTELDKEFEEAEAGPDLVALALLQSQMLEVRWNV
jgi:NADH:ubiquinone oxidoreductase subunit 3 (subunit A)